MMGLRRPIGRNSRIGSISAPTVYRLKSVVPRAAILRVHRTFEEVALIRVVEFKMGLTFD